MLILILYFSVFIIFSFFLDFWQINCGFHILVFLSFYLFFIFSSIIFFLKDKYLNLEGVHVHRDGSSHFTLTDKHTDKSTDALLKQH